MICNDVPGQGDLVGSDLEHQVNNPHYTISARSGYDVKALTYCELKSIKIESLAEVNIRLTYKSLSKV